MWLLYYVLVSLDLKPLMSADVPKGTKVDVLGIGGIGHMTILFAKAMGAEVYAIYRDHSKEEVSKKLGADHLLQLLVKVSNINILIR